LDTGTLEAWPRCEGHDVRDLIAEFISRPRYRAYPHRETWEAMLRIVYSNTTSVIKYNQVFRLTSRNPDYQKGESRKQSHFRNKRVQFLPREYNRTDSYPVPCLDRQFNRQGFLTNSHPKLHAIICVLPKPYLYFSNERLSWLSLYFRNGRLPWRSGQTYEGRVGFGADDRGMIN
jgi:hypothetical protein